MDKAFDFSWWQIDPVFLWTDILVFILVATISIFVIYARRHEHLSAPWRRILHRRLAMSSLIILMAFVVIGLLDSVHFKVPLEQRDDGSLHYSTEVYSLFDRLVLPLKNNTEKTYSEPFAYQLSSARAYVFNGGVEPFAHQIARTCAYVLDGRTGT